MNGPNIPHALHSSQPDDEDWERPSIAVIQFSRESLGIELLQKTHCRLSANFSKKLATASNFTAKRGTKRNGS